ncbi:MAG: hypothetical protein ACKOJF_05315, partial [Planctomycetaceae bacterium]
PAGGVEQGEEWESTGREVAGGEEIETEATAGGDELATDASRDVNSGGKAEDAPEGESPDGVQIAQAERTQAGNDTATRDPSGSAESKGFTTKETQTPFKVVTNYNNFY